LHPDPEAGAPGLAPLAPNALAHPAAFVMLAWAPMLISAGIVIVPSGMAGVRVSQTKGTLAGTLYPGVHFVVPLVERVELFDTRDQLFTTGISEDEAGKGAAKNDAQALHAQALHVQAKEGLTLGLAITVRYQIDPKRLDYIEANLPQPLEKEIVPPVVATAWRELVPGYTVREVFSAKREEVRQRSAEMIRKRLARGRHRGEGSHAARYRTSAGILEGPGVAAAEGTGERPHGRRDGNPPEASENRRSRCRRNQGARSKTG
jgi:hypothetical protein